MTIRLYLDEDSSDVDLLKSLASARRGCRRRGGKRNVRAIRRRTTPMGGESPARPLQFKPGRLPSDSFRDDAKRPEPCRDRFGGATALFHRRANPSFVAPDQNIERGRNGEPPRISWRLACLLIFPVPISRAVLPRERRHPTRKKKQSLCAL